MQAFLFYLTYPLIFVVVSTPFRILYFVSDILCLLLRASGYRKEVIVKNLKNSFPEKSEKEILTLCNEYYRYLCDLALETLKSTRMSEKESRKRCVFHNQPWLTKMREDGQSIAIVMGHHGNWEWAGPGFTLSSKFQLVVVYRPLSNIYFEKMMTRARTRFGTQITAVDKTLRDMVANRGKTTATAFVADQVSLAANAHWMTFLNQDTAVFTGFERLARKFNYPVVYMSVSRVRRGYYEVTPELLSLDPKDTDENEITEKFNRRLEQDIIRDPRIWLWSHRRWKLTKPTGIKISSNVVQQS